MSAPAKPTTFIELVQLWLAHNDVAEAERFDSNFAAKANAALDGERDLEDVWLRVPCPRQETHEGGTSHSKNTAGLNLSHGGWKCHSCNASGGSMDFQRMAKNHMDLDYQIPILEPVGKASVQEALACFDGLKSNSSGRRACVSRDTDEVSLESLPQSRKHYYTPRGEERPQWCLIRRAPGSDFGAKVWWVSRKGEKWIKGRHGTPDALYQEPRLRATQAGGRAVIVVESEKDADNLNTLIDRRYAPIDPSARPVATTWAGGATDAHQHPEWWEVLRGRKVVLWPDNDTEGIQAMRRIAVRLDELEASLWGLPVGRLDKPPKWDATKCLEERIDPLQFIADHALAMTVSSSGAVVNLPPEQQRTLNGDDREPTRETPARPRRTPQPAPHQRLANRAKRRRLQEMGVQEAEATAIADA